MIRFGISTACFYPEYTEKVISELAANEVKWIEIFYNTYSELEQTEVKNLKNVLDKNGMKVISIHPFTSRFEPCLLFSEYYRRFEDGLKQYEMYFNAASLLGAQYVVLHGDRIGGPLSDEEYFCRFGKLRDYARRFGVSMAQENVALYKSCSLDFLKRQKAFLNGDVDFVLDIKQAFRSGEDVFEMVDVLGENIVHLHLSDHLTGQQPNRENDCLPIEKGNFDFPRLFKKLEDLGFHGYGMIELYRHNYGGYEELYDSLNRLKKYEKA